jgi:hypothetical protein
MRLVREWVITHVIDGFLPLAILLFLCSPAGAAVAFAGTPGDGAARSARSGPTAFGGLTSKGWPVYIQLSGNGKRITRAVAAIDSPCTKGGSITVPDKWTNVPIRHGRFKDAFKDSSTENGETFDYDDTFAGKVNRKRTVVSGTWHVKTVIHEADGSVDTCDSGVLKFTARR